MKKFISALALALTFVLLFTACSSSVNWISPMVTFETERGTAHLWNSQYDLHRNETFEYVFHLNGVETAITEAALLSGGAVPATINIAYEGDSEHLTRLVVFAYEFFDHGRPQRIAAHGANPNPADIMVLWRNPDNGQWFNLIQDGIGRTAATMGAQNDGLLSLVRDTPQYTFRFNNETVEQVSELEVFIIANTRPTREDEYDRAGYSLTFTIELPDVDNHFHSWEILAARGTMMIVE